MLVPAALAARMLRKMSCTTSGARPSEGSSMHSSRGSDISARDSASICCSPPGGLVFLRAPLAPMRVTISPSATSKERSRTAGTSPYASSRFCTSSSKFTAKVGRDHRRVALHFARRAFEQRLAVVHDEHAVGDVHHQVHVVLDHDHGHATPGDLFQSFQ